MISASQIEDMVTFRADDCLESSVFVPILDRSLALMVYFDNGHATISDRQLRILQLFLSHCAEALGQIKEALLAHWQELDDWQNIHNCHYETADEAYAAAEPLALRVPGDTDHDPDYCILTFRPAWDPEHGAEVWFFDGRFRYR